MNQLKSIYNATQVMQKKAKRAILAHDLNVHDAIEMLGLGEEKQNENTA